MSQDEDTVSPQMRDYLMKEFGSIGEFAKQMSRHSPPMLEAWIKYRERVFEDSSGGLPKKYKELVGMAIEVVTGRPAGKAAERHARKAIQAGATLREVFDTAMLCEFFSGATNYVDYGLAAVRAAEEEKKGKK
jgi:alkylhydroperoxidase/carboxymuconolactone decarboxylase family protein YurZ